MLDADSVRQLMNVLPFMTMAVKDQPTPVVTRFIEVGIMAVAAAFAGVYVSVPLIQKDIEVINRSITRVDNKVDKVDNKVEKLREDLYAPKGGWQR